MSMLNGVSRKMKVAHSLFVLWDAFKAFGGGYGREFLVVCGCIQAVFEPARLKAFPGISF